jgi:hypothetical protein
MNRQLVCLVVILCSCVEKEAQEKEKVDDGYIKDNLLAAVPTPKHAVNADLGGKVIYLGADVDKESAAIGDRVKVVHYWKVVEAPGAEWRLFTHVNGSVGGDWINVDDTRMRKGYGPDRWKAGDIVRDEQVFPIVPKWKSPDATIYVGMWRKGGQTEKDRMEIRSGASDGKNRVKVATLKIGAGGAAPEEKPLAIPRAEGKIELDGKAEAAWDKAARTPVFVAADGSGPLDETRARFLHDDENLYVFIDVTDADVASSFKTHDDPIWKEDAVELFIDADRSGQGYVELQVSPRGVTFDSWFPTRRPDADPKWESGMKAKVAVNGTLDKRTDEDKGWTAEIAIPLAAVKGKDDKMAVKLPPAPGDTWKLNVVRVDKSKEGKIAASAWAKIGFDDFHAVDRLKTVVFEGAAARPTDARPASDASGK